MTTRVNDPIPLKRNHNPRQYSTPITEALFVHPRYRPSSTMEHKRKAQLTTRGTPTGEYESFLW